jgi:hypothetical protein
MSLPLRFLVVSPTPTWPLDHGNRKRVHQVCSELLQRGHEVHFVFYPAEHDWADRIPHDAVAHMQRQWTALHIVPPRRTPQTPPERAQHGLDEWWDEAVGDALRWLFRVERYDALMINYIWLSKAFELAPAGVLKILDTHDRVGARDELLASQGLQPTFFYTSEADEIEGLARADLALAIKDEEADLFRRACPDTVEVMTLPYVEPGRDVFSGPAKRPASKGAMTFGILGARNSLNRRSTARLLEALSGYLDSDCSRIAILIGGSIGEDFPHLDHPAIKVTGHLPDVAEFYSACDAVVVPLEASTGQKVRVGEALAFGMPLICHRHAFEGYPPRHAMHELPTIEAIAAALNELSDDAEELARLRQATRESFQVLQLRVSEAVDRMVARVAQTSPVTVFAIGNKVLESGPLHMRLALAVRMAAEHGRAAIWLEDTPSPAAQVRLRPLAGSLPVFTAPAVKDAVAGGHKGGEATAYSSKGSLTDFLEWAAAAILWLPFGARAPQFGGSLVFDIDLSDPELYRFGELSPPAHGILVGSRLNCEHERFHHTPFFLGRSNAALWLTSGSERAAWIVAGQMSENIDAFASALHDLYGQPARLWCDSAPRESASASVRPLGRCDLGERLERPELVVVLQPRLLRDPVALELVEQSGAATITVDPANSNRVCRGVHQLADDAELLQLLTLAVRARDTGAPPVLPGQPLPVESFNPASAPWLGRRFNPAGKMTRQ